MAEIAFAIGINQPNAIRRRCWLGGDDLSQAGQGDFGVGFADAECPWKWITSMKCKE